MDEFEKDWRKGVRIEDCIDSARDALQEDPDGQVIWHNNHAYFIKSGSTNRSSAINLPLHLTIARTRFKVQAPFEEFTVGDLKKKIGNDANDITNLIRRMIEKK